MNLSPIYAPVQSLLELTEQEIANMAKEFAEPEVREVLGQFLNHPGKRIRPALLFLAAGAGNPDSQASAASLVNAAAAFELVHSASLVHDDVIDAADSRRNVATVNGRFGNTVAVLAGDILYAQAFLMLSDDVPKHEITLVWDPGTAQEHEQHFTVPSAAYFSPESGKGVMLYYDAAMTQEYQTPEIEWPDGGSTTVYVKSGNIPDSSEEQP